MQWKVVSSLIELSFSVLLGLVHKFVGTCPLTTSTPTVIAKEENKSRENIQFILTIKFLQFRDTFVGDILEWVDGVLLLRLKYQWQEVERTYGCGNGNTFVYEYKTVKWKILLAQNEICIINNDDDVSGSGQIELGLTQFLFPFQSPSRIFGTSRSFRGRYWNESTNAEIKVILVSQLNSHPIQRNPIADSFGMDWLEKSISCHRMGLTLAGTERQYN